MPPVKPKVRDDITIVELDGEAVIFDDRTGELHHLNPTATIVLGLCDGSASMHELSRDISRAFGVPLDEVEPQVRTVVRRFRRAGLLRPAAAARREGTMADA